MRLRHSVHAVAGTLLLFAMLSVTADEVVSPAAIDTVITLENLHQDGTLLRGTLVNRSDRYVQDIELLITYQWRWQNERHPGPQSPAWAAALQLPDVLAPGETREFSYAPAQSIAPRDDGAFSPAATVIRYSAFTRKPVPVDGGGDAGHDARSEGTPWDAWRSHEDLRARITRDRTICSRL